MIGLFPRPHGEALKAPCGKGTKQLYKLADNGVELIPDRVIDWQAYIDSFASEVDYNALIKAHRGDLSVFETNVPGNNLGDISRIQGLHDQPSKIAEIMVKGSSRIEELRNKYKVQKEETKDDKTSDKEVV